MKWVKITMKEKRYLYVGKLAQTSQRANELCIGSYAPNRTHKEAFQTYKSLNDVRRGTIWGYRR